MTERWKHGHRTSIDFIEDESRARDVIRRCHYAGYERFSCGEFDFFGMLFEDSNLSRGIEATRIDDDVPAIHLTTQEYAAHLFSH